MRLKPCPWCGSDVYLDWSIESLYFFTHKIKCPEHGTMMIYPVPIEASRRESRWRERTCERMEQHSVGRRKRDLEGK